MPYTSARPPHRRGRNLSLVPLAVIVVLIILILGGVGCVSYNKTSSVTITVTDKESVRKDDGNEYRVYTNEGTFRVTDSLFHTRFNSSDVYGKLRDNTTYDCKVYGWRIPLFSQFKNILSCKEVTK